MNGYAGILEIGFIHYEERNGSRWLILKLKRVLMSVTDKTGIIEVARALSEDFGAQIISGWYRALLQEAGIPVTPY